MYKIIKKIIKRILMCMCFSIILTTVNCFAMTLENETQKKENNTIYHIQTYVVGIAEEKEFLNTINDYKTIGDITYKLDNVKKEALSTTETINIETTKKIITKSKNKVDILKELPATLDYNENGFTGIYNLDIDTLNIKTNYNGYTEYLVEENVRYTDLQKNDLDYIPKQIKKENITLDLLETTWEIQSTKMFGDNQVADKYIANCYYATKTRKDNLYTYTVTAEYNGIAEKTEENIFEYTVTYKYVIPEKVETPKEDKNINYTPIIVASSGVVIIVLFFFIKRNKKQEVKDNEKDN